MQYKTAIVIENIAVRYLQIDSMYLIDDAAIYADVISRRAISVP